MKCLSAYQSFAIPYWMISNQYELILILRNSVSKAFEVTDIYYQETKNKFAHISQNLWCPLPLLMNLSHWWSKKKPARWERFWNISFLKLIFQVSKHVWRQLLKSIIFGFPILIIFGLLYIMPFLLNGLKTGIKLKRISLSLQKLKILWNITLLNLFVYQ